MLLYQRGAYVNRRTCVASAVSGASRLAQRRQLLMPSSRLTCLLNETVRNDGRGNVDALSGGDWRRRTIAGEGYRTFDGWRVRNKGRAKPWAHSQI